MKDRAKGWLRQEINYDLDEQQRLEGQVAYCLYSYLKCTDVYIFAEVGDHNQGDVEPLQQEVVQLCP